MRTRRTAASPRSIQDRADFAAAMPSSSASAGRPGGCPATFAPEPVGQLAREPAARAGRERVAAGEERAHRGELLLRDRRDVPFGEPQAGRERGRRGRRLAAAPRRRRAARGSRTTSVPAARSPSRWLRRVTRIETIAGDVEQRRALDQAAPGCGWRSRAGRPARRRPSRRAARSAACPACGRPPAPRRRRGRRPRSASGRRRRPRRSRARRCRRPARRRRSARRPSAGSAPRRRSRP